MKREEADLFWEKLCSDGQMPERVKKVLSVTPAKMRQEAVEGFGRILYTAGFEAGLKLGRMLYGDDE